MGNRLIIRVPVRVTTFDVEKNETVDVSTYMMQSKLLQFVQSQTKKYAKKNVTFTARVLYHRTKGVFNEFEFTDAEDFQRKIEPTLERGLLKDLKRDGYLAKDSVENL